MVTISTDKRRITAQAEPEAEARLRAVVHSLRDAQFQAARDLARVDSSAAFVLAGCATIGEYAATLGFDPFEGRDLANLGKALAVSPNLEAMVRGGEIPFRMACALGRVVGNPRYVREGDDWLTTAKHSSWTDLQRRIRERVAEVEQQTMAVAEVSVFVRPAVKDDFERCRRIASDKAGRVLSQDQAFVRVVDHYLTSFDPERRKAHTNGAPRPLSSSMSRYIPAASRRELRQRSGGTGSLGRCEFPGCRCRLQLQHAHVMPKRSGGGQEPGNLFLFCPIHHLLFDAGLLRWIGGPIDDPVFEIVATGEQVRRTGVRRGKARAPPSPGVRERVSTLTPTANFALN